MKVYSFLLTDKELQDVKAMLAKYFAQRLSAKAQKAADAQRITDSEFEAWLNDGK